MSKPLQQTHLIYLDQFLSQGVLFDFARYTFSNCIQNLLRFTSNKVSFNINLTDISKCYLQQYFEEIKNNFQVYNSVVSRQLRKDLPTDIEETTTFQDTPQSCFIKTADFGDDSDRLLQRPDGEFTELMKEIAYYHQKFEEGCERVIVLRAHVYTGYDIQITAAMQCLGYTREQFQYIAVQPLKLYAFHTPSKKITPIPDLSVEELYKITTPETLCWHGLRFPLTAVAPLNISGLSTPEDPYYRLCQTQAKLKFLLIQAERQDLQPIDSLENILWETPETEKLAHLLQITPDILQQVTDEIAPHLLCRHIETISDICLKLLPAIELSVNLYTLLKETHTTIEKYARLLLDTSNNTNTSKP